ncbi:uncharacterized protein LOC113291433 [Papaver somniferum]|uniref:uncharacterized protein LOC113291433 n=1 Tax=Papaver somniferum TaxID=3469 RepID=UPI000E6FA1E9|nr:uncharacterized protein LOC113291433 [Papaver somniferum]
MEIGDTLVTGVHADKGCKSSLSNAINNFNECVDQCGLLQASKSGLQFSWSNGRCGKKRILCNLDRALFNVQWLNTYNGWKYQVSLRGISDHSYLLGSDTEIPKPKNSPFKFQKMWISHPDFLKLVTESWKELLVGNPIFVFINKLKRLKIILKQWNWEIFGDVFIKLKQAEEKLLETNVLSDRDPSNNLLLNNYVTARLIRYLAAQNYHSFVSQKARVNWIQYGDANTAFFIPPSS